MRTIEVNINDLHKVQYDILVEFDRVCKKYKLTYFLAYGTLLGAVRHNGFIPWDDDIDTLMPYEDYLRLKEIPNDEWNTPFFFQDCNTDPEFRVCFSKLRNTDTTLITDATENMDINQGVDIDIYPLVSLSDNKLRRKLQYLETQAYMLLQVNEPPRKHGRYYYVVGKILLSMFSENRKNKLKEALLKNITSFEKKAKKECYVVNGNVEIMRQALPKNWFSTSIPHQFETGEFPIPKGAKDWLTLRYGSNYMELPPKELQGVKWDMFKKIDLNNSYKKYKGVYYCNNRKREKVTNDRWVEYL